MIQLMILDTPQGQRDTAVLHKFRELQRELLYLRYGNDWPQHNAHTDDFWADPSKADTDMLEIIAQYAEHGTCPTVKS